MAIFSSEKTIRTILIHRPMTPKLTAETQQFKPQSGLAGGSFRYTHRSVAYGHPATPSLNTPPAHTFFSPPLKEVPGSWADSPAGVQEQWEERGMLIEVVRECVFPPWSPAAKSTSANSLSALTPHPPNTHSQVHKELNTGTHTFVLP